jgi:hypothetical protein
MRNDSGIANPIALAAEVDDHLQPRGEFHRQIARRVAAQNLVHVYGRAAENPVDIDAVADQPAVIDMIAISIDSR